MRSKRTTLHSRINKKKDLKGFTLIELLVIIAILFILIFIAYIIINPFEYTRRIRDSARISDLASVYQAITAEIADSSASASMILCGPGCTPGKIYTSRDAGASANNGTGWVKVNVANQTAVSLPTLPLDPSNAGNSTVVGCTSTPLEYRYSTTGSDWELDAALESQQYRSKMTEGGGDGCQYEVGSNLTVIP